ncbi:MAG TPA: vanadium-dependent haloperoxidase [Gemmatimonadaceae bacterium]|nr:vanadium-dependent haloperoxidase [Gemmatimonadaceae bacterium]
MQRTSTRTTWFAVVTLALLVGCREATRPPSAGADRSRDPAPDLHRAAGEGADRTSATLAWHAIARDAIRARATDPVPANRPSQNAQLRAYAYFSLAQYDAVVAASHARRGASHASSQHSLHGAVAAASAAALSYFFPAEAPRVEAALEAQRVAVGSSHRAQKAFAAGEAVGRAVAARVIERARTDRFDAVWTGTVPVGPGLWFSSAIPPAPPLLPLQGEVRTFFLSSGSQFRPPPPPAFGSPAFLSALAEVRRISDTRTPEQVRIAQSWALPSISSLLDEIIAGLVEQHGLHERRAAHAFALAFMAGADANAACHDAKYFYWLIRPSQADPAITLSVGLPNHPSYPSNHSCIDGALDVVLSALFPDDAPRIHAVMVEGAISRIYGGIHYRFDTDVGLALGNAVGRVALTKGRRALE